MLMKVIVFVMMSLLVGGASAQEYAFKVLVNKGENALKSGSDWVPLKVGSSLTSGDELKISQNGYLGLVHASGKPLEVKEAGQHKVANLAAKVKEGSSILNKYTDFILSTNEVKRNNLTATGAVYRGDYAIKLFLPRTHSIVFNDEISIAWSKLPDTRTYVISFNSMFGDELEKLEVQDTTVSVNLKGSKFAREDNILVEVSSKTLRDKTSERLMLKRLSSADKKRINIALSEIANQTQEETALNQLILAGFYETQLLLIDAATAYQKAVKLAPGVPEYKAAYDDFIARSVLIE